MADPRKMHVTIVAHLYEDRYRVLDDSGRRAFEFPDGQSFIVSTEPAPIPVPTALGAVILAEVTDCSIPGRLMLVSDGPYPEDGYRWVHVDRPSDTYGTSEITRVHAVLLPGEES